MTASVSQSKTSCLICFREEGRLFPVRHAQENHAKKVDHLFHEHCLLNWARIKNICPLCSGQITHINGKLTAPQIRLDLMQICGEENVQYLFDAIERRHSEDVQMLLNSAVYIDSDHLGRALILAATDGDEIIMESLLQYQDFDEEKYSMYLFKAFVAALNHGHENGALLILERQGSGYHNGPQLIARAFNVCVHQNLLEFMKRLLSEDLHTMTDLWMGIALSTKLEHTEMAQLLRKNLSCFWRSVDRFANCTIQ